MVTRPINRSGQRPGTRSSLSPLTSTAPSPRERPSRWMPTPPRQLNPPLTSRPVPPRTEPGHLEPSPTSPHRAPPPLLQQTRGGKPCHPVLVRRLLPQLPPFPHDPTHRLLHRHPPGSKLPLLTHLPHHHPLLSQQLPHQPLHHLPRPPLLVLDPFPEVPGVPDELPEPRPAPIADREQPPPVGLVGGRLHPRPGHLLPRCPQPPPLLAPTSVGRRGEPGHVPRSHLIPQRRPLPHHVRDRPRHRELPAVEVPALAPQLPDHDQVLLQQLPDHAQHQLPDHGPIGPGPEVLGYAQELPHPGPVVPAAGEHGAAVLRPAQQVDLDLAHGLGEVNLPQHVPWDARDVDVDGGAAVGLRYRPQADPAPAGQVEPVAFLLTELDVTKTHSRPDCPKDNPYREAQLKTLKHLPEFLGLFGSQEDAHSFCRAETVHAARLRMDQPTPRGGDAGQVIQLAWCLTGVDKFSNASRPKRASAPSWSISNSKPYASDLISTKECTPLA